MPESPRITHSSWGTIEVEGRDAPFKDAKLYPGGARAWDWDETGTAHVPGIQPADVDELLAHGAEVVVLAQGHHERLQVQDATLDRLDAEGADVHVLPTPEAVDTYNRLCEEGRPVGALIHSTC